MRLNQSQVMSLFLICLQRMKSVGFLRQEGKWLDIVQEWCKIHGGI